MEELGEGKRKVLRIKIENVRNDHEKKGETKIISFNAYLEETVLVLGIDFDPLLQGWVSDESQI